MRACAIACVLASAGGCATKRPAAPLPRYAWDGAGAALRVMAERDGAIETFSASCDLLLECDDGDRVALTAAIAAEPPDRLRLRAWKFSQAVLDITLNDDGLFLYRKQQGDASDARLKKLTEKRFVTVLELLPGFGQAEQWLPGDVGGDGSFTIVARSDAVSGIECVVDRATLTRRRCLYRDDDGAVAQTLTFEAYRPIGDIVWPMRLEVRGRYGHVDLEFDKVELNEALSPRAFKPPRRAVKQP